MADDSPVQLRDPLSSVARKERRYLLGAALVDIAVVKTGLVPTKISGLGIEFAETSQCAFLVLLGFITLYFLGAFLLYGSSDFLAWRIALRNQIRKPLIDEFQEDLMGPPDYSDLRDKYVAEFAEKFQARTRKLLKLSTPTSILRAIWDFALPILLGAYATVSVWAMAFYSPGT